MDRKNTLIGLFSFFSILILVGFILLLKPSIGDGKKQLRVRFADIEGLYVGTYVNLAGKSIGKVSKISEIVDARKTENKKEIFFYELTLNIDSSAKIYHSDYISIRTTGLLGEKNISIIPRSISEDEKEASYETPIYTDSSNSIEKTMEHIFKISDELLLSIKSINTIFSSTKSNIIDTVENIKDGTNEFKTLINNINSSKIVDNIDNITNSFSISLEKIINNNVIENIANIIKNIDLITQKIDSNKPSEIIDNLSSLTKKLDSMLEDFSNGTVYKLLNNSDLYFRANSVLDKTDIILNDISNYGILFQNNKEWQRQRIKRIRTLNNLTSARATEEFFTREISSINISISRISTILENKKPINSLEVQREVKKAIAKINNIKATLETMKA